MKLIYNKLVARLSLCCAAAFISPQADAHWNSKGPYGGSVTCITTIDTNVLIGTAEGGVFLNSTATATLWKPVNFGMTSGKIGAMTQLGRRIIAGTRDAGIFISSDRGTTWTESNTGLGSLQVQALAFYGNKLFAGTAAGAYLSADSGASWTAVNTGLTATNIAALYVSGTTLYAATSGGGVFVTSDAGTSWTAMNTGLSGTALNLRSLTGDGIMLYASNDKDIYMYMGGTWTTFEAGMSSTYISRLSMIGSTLYAATASGIFQSIGMGAWSLSAAPADTVTAITSIGSKLIAGTMHNGILGSPLSTIALSAANNGFNNLQTYAFVTQDTNNILVATDKGVFFSNDLAASYTACNTGLTDSLHVTGLLMSDVMKVAGTQNGGVYISMTGGAWSALNTGLANLHITALASDYSGASAAIYAATADGKIYTTTAAAGTWTDISSGLPSGLVYNAIAIDGSMLYASSFGNGVYMYMGGSWSAFNSGLTNLDVTSLAVLSGTVFAGTQGAGVFAGSMGSGWTQKNIGLPSLDITSLAAAAPYVAAGYRGGVQVTIDKGDNWQVPGIELNLPTFADVRALSFAKTRVFAGTPGNALYSNALSELPTTAIGEIGQVAAKGSILIAPNPNRGGFRLQVADLQANELRGISLYDITGREVQKLANKATQDISTSLAPGSYFIRVTTDSGSLTQKLVIQ